MPKGFYERSPETKERLRRARLGVPHSHKTREKIRQAMLGNKYRLGRRASAETRRKMRQAQLGREFSPEHREKLRQARLRRILPRKMTSIECLLRDEFRKRRLKFEMHKPMFGRFQPDFVFEQVRLIVQADGDYWHSTPRSRKQDAAFAEFAAADGWSVWRFGEKEIHMHSVACARAVAKFIRSHS